MGDGGKGSIRRRRKGWEGEGAGEGWGGRDRGESMGRGEMEQGVYCYHGNLIIYAQRGCSGDIPVKGVLH